MLREPQDLCRRESRENKSERIIHMPDRGEWNMERDKGCYEYGAFSHNIGFNNLARSFGEYFNSLMG